MQNGGDKTGVADGDDTKTFSITIRLVEDSGTDMEEKTIKVLPRIHVSHLLKILSWSFNKSGFYNQDFDAFLIQDKMEIQLDLNHRISEYGIKNEDIIEVRRKKLFISLKVNIHQNDVREYQVNASIPVYETVKLLGSMLNVENTKELSLALPITTEKSVANVTSNNWLDPTKSLNEQSVTSGDTILLRKKYFIFNEDIGEAEHNPVLRDLLLHQFKNQLSHSKNATIRKTSRACSFGIPSTSEASDLDSLSDQEGSLETSSFLSDVLKSLEKSVSELNVVADTPKEDWMETLSKHKEMNSFFPVKSSTCSEANYLCIKSGGVYLTVEAQFSNEFVRKWSVEEITSWCKFENGLKITANGTSHTFFSDQLDQILEHLNHLSFLTEKEASGSKQDNNPSTRLSLSPALSITSSCIDSSSISSHEEEAGTGVPEFTSTGAEATDIHHKSSSFSRSPPPKRENTTNISPPTYFGLNYKELLETHMLIHIIVLNQEIRQILVDVTQPVRSVIRDICATYGMQFPEEHFLRYPNSTEEILQKYGGRPKLESLTGEFVESTNPTKHNIVLDADQPLIEQLYFDIQPVVLLLRRINFDEVDAAEKYSLDIGCEWPDGEDPGVARYRHFYQCWMSVIQGNRDINKSTAVRLAGILTYLYQGSRKSAPLWPPLDFDSRCFLPQKFQNVIGIGKDVLKFHKKYGDADIKDAIEEVIAIVEDIPYSNGLQFSVKVPTKSEMLRLKKLEQRTLCISRDGIACLANGGKKDKCFRGEYCDIRNWASSDASFRLSFGDESDDFYAYTYQSRQIMEMMQLYVKMAYNDDKKNPEKKIHTVSDV